MLFLNFEVRNAFLIIKIALIHAHWREYRKDWKTMKKKIKTICKKQQLELDTEQQTGSK